MTQTADTEVIKAILISIFGELDWDDSVDRTAERWLDAMAEFRASRDLDFNFTVFPTSVNQLIAVRNIEFASICAHHLFPFQGVAHVGYIPNKLQVGLSKIPRLVHHYAKRPQTQERMTRQIAVYLKDHLEAQGVAVVIESRHTCMSCRGVNERNAVMVTSEMRGAFINASPAREEFMRLIGAK